MLIISYDDGPETDYTVAFKIHKQWRVPAETCVVSERIGKKGSLNVQQLLEMQESGWEIVSHSKNHLSLRMEPIMESALQGDSTIYLKGAHRFKPGTECILKNNKFRETVIVSEHSKAKKYINLKDSIKNDYPVYKARKELHKYLRGGLKKVGLFVQLIPLVNKVEPWLNVPVVHITKETALKEIAESKKYLITLGLNVNNFSFPYNAYDELFLKMLAQQYKSVRTSGERLNRVSKHGKKRPLLLYCYNFQEDKISEKKITRILDNIDSKNIGIMYAHTWASGFTVKRLNFLIESAQRRGIKIITRRQMFEVNDFGN